MARAHTIAGGQLTNPEFEIPLERLPPGFAEKVDSATDAAAVPRPAATAVLMRDAGDTIEILLLKRHRSSGFVPGAYVFPGGRVDADDAKVDIADVSEPAHEYWVAAVREIFEETGVLLAQDANAAWAPDCATDPTMEAWREQLMSGTAALADVLSDRQLVVATEQVAYFAHWITPLAEPRRYDTRFFLAALPAGRTVRADPREMTDALWLTVQDALNEFEAGRLPMVFPTVRTLQALSEYTSVEAAFNAARTQTVMPILPRLVRTRTGVGIVIDQETE